VLGARGSSRACDLRLVRVAPAAPAICDWCAWLQPRLRFAIGLFGVGQVSDIGFQVSAYYLGAFEITRVALEVTHYQLIIQEIDGVARTP
jgi:hypothetical protein